VAQGHEGFNLEELLKVEVSSERIERLKELTSFDDSDVTPEVEEYLLRQFAKLCHIQYGRFLAGVTFTEEDIDDCMCGAIDIHTHGGSDPFDRLLLEDEMAIEHTQARMRALVIKTWYTPSASRVAMTERALNLWLERQEDETLVPARVFGGITLNASQGGLNPEAVKKCLGFRGMKYVWMPMVDSYHHRRVVFDDRDYGLRIVDDKYNVLEPLKEICKIASDNNLTIASGHYPAEDTRALMECAKKAGVKHMEIIHPTHIHSKHTIEDMKQAASEGVKLMLMGLGSTCFPIHETGPLYSVRMIKEVGAENLVYGSDLGQIQNPSHVTITRWLMKMLLSFGATKEEVKTVFQTAPAAHLELD
jgi:hypothetical protein